MGNKRVGSLVVAGVLSALVANRMAFAEQRDEVAPSGYGKTEGVAGSFLFGPKLTGGGLPLPLRFGIETKFQNLVGLSFDYGLFPTLSISDVKLGANGWTVAAKLYPFRESFFLGVGMGRQTLEASRSEDIAGSMTRVEASMDSTLLVPQIGWRWVWDSGLWLGTEIGVQIPISNSGRVTTNGSAAVQMDPSYAELEDDVESIIDKIGDLPLPQMAFAQIGFFF
jgi:hypothetical protein